MIRAPEDHFLRPLFSHFTRPPLNLHVPEVPNTKKNSAAESSELQGLQNDVLRCVGMGVRIRLIEMQEFIYLFYFTKYLYRYT